MPDPWRMSLVQSMKLVLFAAVASACVAPMLQLWQMGVVDGGSRGGLVFIAVFEAVAVPVAWAGLAFVIVRRGAWRDGVIAGLLLGAVTVALGTALWMLFAYAIPTYGRPYGTGPARLAVHLAMILALFTAALFLARRLIRGASRRIPGA